MNIIELKKVTKVYKQGKNVLTVFKDLDLSVATGEMIAVMGRSGVGKSSLLHIIGGLSIPTQGEFWFQGENLKNKQLKQLCYLRQKHIAFIPQNFVLMDDRKAINQIMLPLELKKMKKRKRREIAYAMLERLGIPDKSNCYPDQLSGGECQRVAIARALVIEPDVILADEPTSALDEETEREILKFLKELQATGITIILSTHDHQIAQQCDRTVTLLR